MAANLANTNTIWYYSMSLKNSLYWQNSSTFYVMLGKMPPRKPTGPITARHPPLQTYSDKLFDWYRDHLTSMGPDRQPACVLKRLFVAQITVLLSNRPRTFAVQIHSWRLTRGYCHRKSVIATLFNQCVRLSARTKRNPGSRKLLIDANHIRRRKWIGKWAMVNQVKRRCGLTGVEKSAAYRDAI